MGRPAWIAHWQPALGSYLSCEVLRSHYTLTLSGNLALGGKLEIEVWRPGRFVVSVLPFE